jgi:uncharacterized protein YbbC (DUF1343 family)
MPRSGLDQLLQATADEPLRKARLGFITNDCARTGDGQPARVALREGGFRLERLFSPEHGLSASAADGEKVGDSTDPLTSLPVFSLYGQHVRPTAESIRDLDAILFDIPEVGCRYYTYIWTLSHALEACAGTTTAVVVLDRPNPVGGMPETVEGPWLDEERFSTLVGRWSMPVRYSLTIGELARHWVRRRRLDVNLRVVPLSGWKRDMLGDDGAGGLSPPSPAMRDLETALLYPGTCLLEGTNLSEGRGTDSPFKLIGAPWLDGDAVAEEMTQLRLPGVRFAGTRFTPNARKYAGADCGGVRISVSGPSELRPVRAAMHLLRLIRELHPGRLRFHHDPDGDASGEFKHFDRLAGTTAARDWIVQMDSSIEQLDQLLNCPAWWDEVAPDRLYD